MSSATSSMSTSYMTCFSTFCLNAPATTDIYTLSLHDALPILGAGEAESCEGCEGEDELLHCGDSLFGCCIAESRCNSKTRDRKSTRLTPVTRPSRMPSSA